MDLADHNHICTKMMKCTSVRILLWFQNYIHVTCCHRSMAFCRARNLVTETWHWINVVLDLQNKKKMKQSSIRSQGW